MAFVSTCVLPRTGLSSGVTSVCTRPAVDVRVCATPMEIQAAKHAQFKATKKHYRRRPKKRRPSDINRAPPSFDPEPLRAEGLPPVMTIIPAEEAEKMGFGQQDEQESQTEQVEPAAV